MWPLRGIFGTPAPKTPSARRNSELVTEALLSELDNQVKLAVEKQKQQRRLENERQGRPDYSWLVDDTNTRYKMPQLIRLEIEDLGRYIEPDRVTKLIHEFRKLIKEDTQPEQLAGYMKFMINYILQKQLSANEQKRRGTKIFNFGEIDYNIEDSKHLIETDPRSLSVAAIRDKRLTNPHPPACRAQSAPASTWKFLRKGRVVPEHDVEENGLQEFTIVNKGIDLRTPISVKPAISNKSQLGSSTKSPYRKRSNTIGAKSQEINDCSLSMNVSVL